MLTATFTLFGKLNAIKSFKILNTAFAVFNLLFIAFSKSKFQYLFNYCNIKAYDI